jgi:hypothetical protein
MAAYQTFAPQPCFPGFSHLAEAVEELASAGAETRGAIFTRPEVVEFILDLVGYTAGQPLHQRRILEPSFGGGDFLFAIARRLLSAYRSSGGQDVVADLSSAICAVELHRATFQKTCGQLENLLLAEGIERADARALRNAWLVRDDFLLTAIEGSFTHVVGNPPYVRQELIPQILIDEYRSRYSTIYDRADMYVPFIERCLGLLAPRGALGFICADRWMKNRYGGPLRRLIAHHFHLRAHIDIVDTPAFLSDVIAYPAIFVIGNERGNVTRLARRPRIDREHLAELANAINATTTLLATVKEIPIVTDGSEPWLLESFDELAVVRRLENQFPTLEDAGCKVGIGVATGADKAFIGPMDELDVEPDRKLPLAMTRDIVGGTLKWRGLGVVNPFAPGGGLVSLEDYPRLKRFLLARKAEIAARHIAQKTPASWYRTIDRIYPELVAKPKLLIPDIKGAAHIVYDPGACYPHHNLYFVTSDTWDLHALQAVLLSGIARLFISAYSTKMRGGYLRFQAQYLRRIRVPFWNVLTPAQQQALTKAGRTLDPVLCNQVVADIYGLDDTEKALLFAPLEAA